jgi:hypothetical protein
MRALSTLSCSKPADHMRSAPTPETEMQAAIDYPDRARFIAEARS